MHFLTQILTWSLISWEHRSPSSQEGAEHVLQPVRGLETLAELGSTASVLARSRAGTKSRPTDAFSTRNSHLVPDILGASIAKQPGGYRARSTARGRPRNTCGARQHGLGPGSISSRNQKWPTDALSTRNSHLVPDILGASIAKQPGGCRARSTARGGPRNTPWPRQHSLGPGSISSRNQKWPTVHFRPEIPTWSLISWEHRSPSSQEGAEHVLQPAWALETLSHLVSTASVWARPRSGSAGGLF
jgi:hypothetical protein